LPFSEIGGARFRFQLVDGRLVHAGDPGNHRPDLGHEHRAAQFQPNVTLLVAPKQEIVKVNFRLDAVVAQF
jgi:hypothetical protein